MTIIAVCLALLAVLYLIFMIGRRHVGTPVQTAVSCASCDGHDTRCEQECMMEAATRDIVYFDDEELDHFRGRPSDSYTDDETEAFREVLYTMRPEETKEWNRSLILRGVNVPDQLKDELVMLMEG